MGALSFLESPPLTSAITELLRRIRAEYVEMPGLNLTAPQAQRMWGLDCATCETVLATLVEATFLSRTRKGLFVMAAAQRPDQPRIHSGMFDASDLVGARQACSGTTSSIGRRSPV